MLDDLTVYIAAGGRGRRLGLGPKAGVRLHGVRLLDAILTELAGLRTFVVGDPGVDDVPVPVVVDRFSDRGVPGALDAALAHCETTWALVLAVDMPRVQRGAIEHLASLRADELDAVVPVVGGRRQPLHALYRVPTCAPVAESIARGRGGALEVLKALRLREVDLGELSVSATDVDTPEDLDELA